ncbi:hypothetical protein ACRAWF_26045, partial [Streptomyces sp. L7]
MTVCWCGSTGAVSSSPGPRSPSTSGGSPGQPQTPGHAGGLDGTWASRTLDFKTVAAGPRIGRRAGHRAQASRSLRSPPAADGGRRPDVVETLHVPHALVPGLTARDLETDSFYRLLGRRRSCPASPTPRRASSRPPVDEWRGHQSASPWSAHLPLPCCPTWAARDAEGRVVEFTRFLSTGVTATASSPGCRWPAGLDGGQRAVDGSWSAATTVPGADTLAFDPYWS